LRWRLYHNIKTQKNKEKERKTQLKIKKTKAEKDFKFLGRLFWGATDVFAWGSNSLIVVGVVLRLLFQWCKSYNDTAYIGKNSSVWRKGKAKWDNIGAFEVY
jgi:hypothetical protein